MMVNINSAEKIFKEKGFKLTNQRKAIIEVLLEHRDQFLSVEEIFLKSKEKYPQTNLSTIYRNLEMMEKTDIVHKTTVNGTSSYYQLICDECHHHHVICKNCGKTGVIDFCPMDSISSIISNSDFIVTDHKIELYGYCKNCAKKAEK
ncbi:Fur family zinc uptake regulator [Fonticella tunisiensis]|uniref:Fur family zinc uptake regulator n=2 Tax=Fonticella tunisiensis TaxID=1096341 RepID=A0A4R7KNY2_9CLOT|nr:Fur family zinc uptake regulator [Fonticella tunisiensis]